MEAKDWKGKVKSPRQQMVDKVILIASALVAVLYIYTSKAGELSPFQQMGILFGFCFVLVFIKNPMFKGKRPAWTIAIDVFLSIATLLCVYQLIHIEAVSKPGSYYKVTSYDIVLGALLIVATLEATRRRLGIIMPMLAIISLLYAAFGHNLPGIFSHTRLELSMIVHYLSLMTEGIFGLPVYVVSTIVIVYLIFAAMLQKMGLGKFFIDLATGLMGKYRGGPAKISVISSAFFAMISGSAVANVVSTGVFTIPLMKRIGYPSNFAGAVEAAASTGGVTTPPVMGAAAFIMAELLGVSYWAVCVAAALPSVLYYVSVYMGVDLEAVRLGLKGLPKEELPSVGKTLLGRGFMLAPAVVLVYLMAVEKSSPMLAAFWALLCILAVALLKKDTRREVFGLGMVEALANGVKDCITVVTVCACVGIVIGVMVVSGLGMRLGTVLIAMSGGNLIALLTLCAVVCIILGTGITGTAIYLMMAMTVAPAIVKLGVLPLAAHLFVFFLANLSNITPPVAVAVFVACGISGGDYLPTGWQACKLGAVLFIVPFFFCLNPALILQASLLDAIIATLTAILGCVVLAFGISGYWWWGRISLLPRLLFGLGGLAMIYPVVLVSAIGGGLILVAVLYQLRLGKAKRVVS